MSEDNKLYVFNDTETTGLNTWFSQIIQIGSVLSDENFEVLEELDISSKVLPWVVPTVGAYRVHKQIDSLDNNMSHHDMMTILKDKWSEWSKEKNLIHVTYNGMKFDEELFRRQFYWNLYDPYMTNTNGANRIDLMVIMMIIANFYSDQINFPTDDDGKIKYKLELLAEKNGISAQNAHDAVVDCYLMINLLRVIKEKIPEVWNSAVLASSKSGCIELLNSEPFCMQGELYGGKKFTYPVVPCGQNPNNKNEIILADLYFDPKELFEMKDSELKGQFGRSGAFKKIAINKTIPLINSKKIPNLSSFLDVPEKQLEERAKLIRENIDFQERVSNILGDNQFNWPAQEIVEQRIYDGFPSEADKLWRDRFELAPWAEKVKLIEGFEDERYRELAERIVCYQKPEFASDEMIERFQSFVKTRLFSKGPWLKDRGQTLDQAIVEAETMLAENNNEEDVEILEKLLDHYREKKSNYS
ncbi:exonuclease domain-containing protein [SAR86 cluster bacterium]|nr:exonuclease domain-containing protein [SAR86 cluster bacterium]